MIQVVLGNSLPLPPQAVHITGRHADVATLAGAGLWVGDCFIYTNSAWRLNYCVGGEVTTMFHLDRPMYLLGYLASQSRIYLIDKVRCPRSVLTPCAPTYEVRRIVGSSSIT